MLHTHSAFHVIKDPVYGSMQFTDEENRWIKPFIDSPHFQRLRHIKQLGLGDLVFPGAVHTRFNHALGCCYAASQISEKLNLPHEQRKIVMLACLLHDIGHGPFSHAFEWVFNKKLIQHEDWTPLFLDEYAKKNIAKQSGFSLSDRDFSTIKSLIMHQETEQTLLADIVSSQLDADRLDYLRRDSHFCGVTYGEYDFQWLLHCLTIVSDEKKQERLGITHKGIGSVEQYLMARRLMVRNIYLHGKKYAAEFLLTSFLQHLAKAIAEQGLFKEVKDKNLARFLLAVAEFNCLVEKKENIDSLKSAFLQEQYPLYKKLCDYDVLSMIRYFSGLETDHAVVHIAKRLYSRQLPKVLPIEENHLPLAQTLIDTLQKKNDIQPWQCHLVVLPHQSYQKSSDPILVVTKSGKVQNIHDNSLVISGISDKYENTHWLFIDRELLTHSLVTQFVDQLI